MNKHDINPIYEELPILMEMKRNLTEQHREILKHVRGPFIHNVVMTARDSVHVEDFQVSRLAYPAFGSWNKDNFASPFSIKCRGVTVMFMDGGIINLVGADSEDEALLKLYEVLLFVYKKTGFRVRVHDFRVQNMQATLYLGYTIDLQRLSEYLPLLAYEPSNINLGKYTVPVKGGSINMLIFPTGSVVLVKGKSMAQFEEARDLIIPTLVHFAVNPVSIVQKTIEMSLEKKRKDKKRKKKTNH